MNAGLGLLPTCLHRAPRLGKHMPHVPTTAERLRNWHNAREPQPGNSVMDWRALAEAVRTPHGSQSGANPGPSNPAGCHPFGVSDE